MTTSRGTGELILRRWRAARQTLLSALAAALQRWRRRHGTGAGGEIMRRQRQEIGFGGGSLNTLNDIDISGLIRA